MQPRLLVRADLVTGIALVILGLATLAESFHMPRLEERSINPWTVPGLVPGLLGAMIAVLGATLALRSSLAGGLRSVARPDGAEAIEARDARARLLLCLGFCLAYAVLLVGRVPFWLATGLFVFVFIAFFEWRRGDNRRTRLGKLAVAGIIAGVALLTIPLLFERLFLVRLP
jgi:hypothetical protein